MSSGRYKASEPGAEDDSVSTYWLRVGRSEVAIGTGDTLIGRGEDCAIIVRESLVSRRHARIVLDKGRPYIEDLGSANGTFVNQAKLHGKALLFPGDHIFVGTCEIEVIRRVEDRATVPGDTEDEPASGVGTFEPSHTSSSAQRRLEPTGPARPSHETTTEMEGLEYLGHLADKMFTMGRIDAAVRILAGQIEDIMRAARGGQVPGPAIVDAVGRYAVKLTNETLDSKWLDAAIELHLVACRPLRNDTIQQLALLRAKAPLGDEELLTRYHLKLRSEMAGMPAAERTLCDRIACLLPGADRPT